MAAIMQFHVAALCFLAQITYNKLPMLKRVRPRSTACWITNIIMRGILLEKRKCHVMRVVVTVITEIVLRMKIGVSAEVMEIVMRVQYKSP